MTIALASLALVFLVAFFAWASARRRLLECGVLEGRIVYQDTDRHRIVERPLISHRCGLTGKPDYLVARSNQLIPIELKSRSSPPSGPYASDAAQVAAYCALVEDSCGVTPSYGIIQYADRTWPIRYTIRDRDRILVILAEMRDARQSITIHRDHTHAARCRACGYRAACDEALD